MKDVYVVLPEQIGTVAPEIYGHFAEHIGGVMRDGAWVGKDAAVPNIRGWRKEIVDKLRAINAPVIRWPGGCFAETYDWRDGIGENRPVRINWWTSCDGRYETNEVGTHEFMDFCELVGAKPYVAVNATSITPLEARNWLDYCLSPAGSTTLALEREKNGRREPFRVPYFGGGNENWGGGGNMSPESYAMEYRRFAQVMQNVPSKEPTCFITCGASDVNYDWTRRLVKTLSEGCTGAGGMSVHYYCGGAGECTDYTRSQWYELIGRAQVMEELIDRHYGIVRGYKKENELKLVVDEWGCWHPGGSGPSKGYNLFEQQSTMRDACVAALTLNIFNNACDKVKMANVAQLCNNLHCLFLADKTRCVETVTYHVFDMYKTHMGGTCVRTVIPDNDDPEKRISVSASVKDGILTMTIANLSCDRDINVKPDILGGRCGEFSVTSLSSADMRDCNTFDEPEKIMPVCYTTDKRYVTVPKAGVVTIRAKLAK